MGKTTFIIELIIFNIFIIAFLSAIAIYIRQYKIKKKEHNMIIHHKEEEHQKELLSTQLEIQQQTMQHIGREIHDNIGQKLTLASLYTQQLAYENKAPQINTNIENISSIINESLIELRELSKSLTNNTIDSTTLSKLLEEECSKINESKICTVHLNTDGEKSLLSYQIKSILLRIVQEFIQNSIKHAQCKNINVSLNTRNEHLILSLEDDGKGFEVDSVSNGIGLANIKKRTEIIGGNYHLQSNANGTKLVIEIPLNS
jgi:signal transduction histidine kinase